MSESEKDPVGTNDVPVEAVVVDPTPTHANAAEVADSQKCERRDSMRWWIKLFVQPLLLLTCALMILVAIGVAQRLGLISAGAAATHQADAATRYICPMMCTPPQTEPGRCPVCAMELVPATSGSGTAHSQSIDIGPAARRVANIRTAVAESMAMTRTVRAIGELSYDEGSMKTISAYVDGRIDQLYADYTGVVVEEGDHLALVYSPKLYSAQVEFLLARKAMNRPSTLSRVVSSNRQLYENARHRLIELGMIAEQIDELEKAGKANSRVHLCAPTSGTVIEKAAVEGDYVKEGQPIYRVADLSTVWLMLELFPEDASSIRYQQKVTATVQSLPGRTFAGRVAFIAPKVDPATRTVGIRVVIPNDKGLLRVGDYGKATIELPLTLSSDEPSSVYDPELADKWISPRHPHVVENAPGKCRVCGVALVPAAEYGFSADPVEADESIVVPRNAVLMAGGNSVLYVESAPGRFEIRRVELGPTCGEQIVIVRGVRRGERVATQGNFLIDSQMQLAGNPSLIDPSRALPISDEAMSSEMIAALAKLSEADRHLVETQRTCPVADYRLGEMGPPIKVDVQGTPVFICCESCRESLLEEPERYLAKISESQDATPQETDLPPIGPIVPAGDIEMVEPHGSVPGTTTSVTLELPPITAPIAVVDGSADAGHVKREQASVASQQKELVR